MLSAETPCYRRRLGDGTRPRRGRGCGEAAVGDAAVTGPAVACVAAQPATVMIAQAASRSVVPGALCRPLLVHLAGPLGARPGRPGRDGPLETLTVHNDIEPLTEECDEAADLHGVVLRLLVGPRDVGDDPVAGRGRPV